MYHVYFPDFDNTTCGETLEEAADMARDTLVLWLHSMPAPEPSELEDVQAQAADGDIVLLVEEGTGDNIRFADR